MVMGGRHGLTRKPRAVGIMTIFLGFCLVSSLWLTLYSIVRARHLSVEEPLDFTSGIPRPTSLTVCETFFVFSSPLV